MSVTQSSSHQKTVMTKPPVVVILGHVDHGKSSLLEAIRDDFRITAKESGGITQHIGAYQAEYRGHRMTFLDTPGHEAFSAMRSRGARVADVAILVVAADDGVKPQTAEAIRVIEETKLPFVIAITKTDKPESNPDRVRQQLAEKGVYTEKYGGKVSEVLTSATQKTGIQDLLEMVLLVAEIEELKCDPRGLGRGIVVESFLDAKRGPATTILVRDGHVVVGDTIGTSSSVGKIRILEDFQGVTLKEALPGMPALVIGFEASPAVGEEFSIYTSEGEARTARVETALAPSPVLATSEGASLTIILKADVGGSLEAIQEQLAHIPQGKVILQTALAGVGDVTEADVKHAQGTGALIIAFRVKGRSDVIDLANRNGIAIERFDIIYELIERIRSLMESRVAPEVVREEVGELRVLAVFSAEKKNQIIGGKVTKGEVRKGCLAEIVRDGEAVGKGKVKNVQQGKVNVSSARKGEECGLMLEGGGSVQEGDTLRFGTEEVRQGGL
ncbi:MAG: translation initiation factor IF-2 [bacterium]|nr:translation initiation factor IF-2 [bacterium]